MILWGTIGRVTSDLILATVNLNSNPNETLTILINAITIKLQFARRVAIDVMLDTTYIRR